MPTAFTALVAAVLWLTVLFANLAESEEVVMRVRFEGEAPPASRMYWRGPAFGDFDGRVWRPSRYGAAAPPQPEVRLDDLQRPPLRYTATLEPSAGRWVLALETATRVPVLGGERIMITPSFELVAGSVLASRVRFDGEASLDAQIGRNETPASLRNWLELPAGFIPLTLAMAARSSAVRGLTAAITSSTFSGAAAAGPSAAKKRSSRGELVRLKPSGRMWPSMSVRNVSPAGFDQ